MADMDESKFRQSLEALAWRICSVGRQPVAIDQEDGSLFEQAIRNGTLLEDEQGVRFADETAMVSAATQHVLHTQRAQLLSSPKACFEGLHEIFRNEIGKEPAVSGHVLAALHNAGRLDAFAWGRQAIEAGVHVFDVLHVMKGAIALFEDAPAEAVYEFFVGHYEHVKNDLFGGLLYAELPAWLARHADTAHEIKRLHEAKPQERSASLYGCALHGLILQDFVGGFALTLAAMRSQNPMIAGPALHILGLADYCKAGNCGAVEKVIQECRQILDSSGHPLLGTAVSTLGRLITINEETVVELLFKAAKSEAPEALYALSEMLLRTQDVLESKGWFWPLFLHLAAAQIEHRGILRNIDSILMGWVADPIRQSQVLEFLNAWIARQSSQTLREGDPETYFPSIFHELAKQPQLLSKALTGWLLEDDSRYPLIAHKVILHFRTAGIVSLSLDPSLIDELKPNEIRFLLRRILGYVIGDEVQIHLVFSLVRSRDATERTFPWVSEALCNQVGYDYPHQAIEFLKKRQTAQDEADDVKALCADIASAIQARFDALDALPRLKEFQPSSSKVRRFAKARQKQMNEALEEASKQSIVRQLVTNVVLKAGRRTFQNFNGRYTEPMQLKEMSHAVALPRSEICDPAGAARERLLYRMAKKDTP
ncbi:MAG: hypothetical protein ACOY3L_19155 [Pseudomonadota bacterium]